MIRCSTKCWQNLNQLNLGRWSMFTMLKDIITFEEIQQSLIAVYGTSISQKHLAQIMGLLATEYNLIDVINTLDHWKKQSEK